MLRKLGHFSADARAADTTTLTGKSDVPLMLAGVANNAHEAAIQNAAIYDGFELTPDEARQVHVFFGELVARRGKK